MFTRMLGQALLADSAGACVTDFRDRATKVGRSKFEIRWLGQCRWPAQRGDRRSPGGSGNAVPSRGADRDAIDNSVDESSCNGRDGTCGRARGLMNSLNSVLGGPLRMRSHAEPRG